MITFTELEIVLMIGWLITVIAFLSVNRKINAYIHVMDTMHNIIEGVADNRLQVKRDKSNNVHISTLENP